MCEYDSNFLKNDRILTKPWRTRIVLLKKNEWVDIDLVGVLLFLHLKRDSKSDDFCEYMAIYKDIYYQSTIDKNPDIFIIRPQIDEKVLKKLHQNFQMPEGECLLFSMIDKRNNYSLVSENFIEWKDKTIGEHIGLVFFNNMSCFETWKKISEIKKLKANVKRKDKSVTLQCETYLRVVLKENLPKIQEIIEKHIKSIVEIVLNQEFLQQLKDIFLQAEFILDANTLLNLYNIIDVFLKAGLEQIFNVLMNDLNYNWVLGVLEYSPENRGFRKNSHRITMNLQTTYKNLNGILTEEIGWKIQWCYRQSYLLDCVLAADNEANFFFVLQRNIYNLQQEILNEVLKEDLIEEIFRRFLTNWKDSIEFLIELFSLIDNSTHVEKKKFFISKLKSMNFLEFSANLLAFLMSWNIPYPEKQFWLIKFLKMLKSFLMYDTIHFLRFLETELSRNLFIPMFANLFIFYGFETQIEIEEIWKFLMDDLKNLMDSYSPFMDFLEKCLFFQDKVQIRELFFEEFINLCVISLQKKRENIQKFLLNNGRIEKFFEIVLFHNKKAWIISLLKLLKELVSKSQEDFYFANSFKNALYILFSRYFRPFKENLIKSLFLDLFYDVIKQKNHEILHPEILQNLEFRKARKLSLSKTPEKSIFLENGPSNLSLSIQKIDEFEATSKESLPETIIQLVIEEEAQPKPCFQDKMSIEEDFLE